MSDLLNAAMQPCPFCGHTEHLEIVDSKEGLAKVVKCWACGTVGPYGASNESLAIEFWNSRAAVEVIGLETAIRLHQ